MNIRISTSSSLFLLASLLFSPAIFSTELEPYRAEGSARFSLTDLKGKTHTLADYRGKVVLVNFWASWCTPCVLEMPELTQLKQHMLSLPFARQSFEILAINVGERENRVKHFAKRTNFNLPVLLDISSKVFKEWNIEIMPTSFLIDANGSVRYHVQGNPGWDNEQILSLIEQLIKEAEKPERTRQ